jgi:hypothetical protein
MKTIACQFTYPTVFVVAVEFLAFNGSGESKSFVNGLARTISGDKTKERERR